MEKPSPLTSIIAGGIAGATETLITFPFEFIKTRRQLPTHSASTIAIIRSTVSSSGLTGLYSGCRVLAISNFFKSGVRFFSFEAARSALGPASTASNIFAGLMAGVTESILVVTPGEAIKTRLIHDSASSQARFKRMGLFVITRKIIQENGVFSLWRGLTPVLFKQGTNSAVRFGSFGFLQEKLPAAWKGTTLGTFAVGAISGFITVYASMPFDNIKTRMQSINTLSNAERPGGISSYFKQMLMKEGVLVFWRGTTPRLMRVMLSSSISFTIYDLVVHQVKDVQTKLQMERASL